MAQLPEAYNTDEGLLKLADYLRSADGVKIRHSIEHGRRVEYFKGEKLAAALLNPTNWPSSLPAIKTEDQVVELGNLLIQKEYFHRSEKRKEGSRRWLELSRKQTFEVNKAYFTWMYEGSKTWSNIMTGLIVVGFLFMTCFPIWPMFLKVWLWYASVSLLGLITGLLLVRGCLFVLGWILGFDFWIFPRLFDESLGFLESFTPLFSAEKAGAGQGLYRVAVLIGLAAFAYWAYTQPTEFDDFVSAQKQFVTDIYEGNLLADVAQEAKENIDKPVVPNLEDLLRELDEEMSEEERMEEEIIAQLMDEQEAEDMN